MKNNQPKYLCRVQELLSPQTNKHNNFYMCRKLRTFSKLEIHLHEPTTSIIRFIRRIWMLQMNTIRLVFCSYEIVCASLNFSSRKHEFNGTWWQTQYTSRLARFRYSDVIGCRSKCFDFQFIRTFYLINNGFILPFSILSSSLWFEWIQCLSVHWDGHDRDFIAPIHNDLLAFSFTIVIRTKLVYY